MSARLAQTLYLPGDAPVAADHSHERMLTVGRSGDNDLVLDDPRVSGRHARVLVLDGRAMVEDLGSSNGTSLGRIGHRVDRAPLAPSDTVYFGPVAVPAVDILRRLEIDAPESAEGSWIEARDVSMAAGGKTLIDGVSLTVAPGELVGMMGPSGAGKTTLLNVLAGLTPPATGRVRFDGLDLYRHHSRFRRSIGYVPQDDVMHEELTVRQALRFAARLRLPPGFRAAALERRIDRILEQLGIDGIDDVPIGSPVRKGISGGQRKRVNLAMELLTDPPVLFLDEPTSGLSSEDALQVMKVLRELADRGKTVLLTLHQPSLEAYRTLDRLVLLGKEAGSPEPGRLVYAGSAWPGAVQHFAPEELSRPQPSPDAVLRELGTRPVRDWVDRWHRSPERAAAERPAGGRSSAPPRSGPETDPEPGPFRQWRTLVHRMLTIKMRDRWTTLVHVAQAPLIALLVVLIWGDGSTLPPEAGAAQWREATGAVSTSLFLTVIAALWFGCSNAAREIVAEQSVYRRERMVSLGIVPYLGSKLAVLGGLCGLQCTVLLAIVGSGCGLQAGWGALFPPLLLAALAGTALGLALSAMAPSSEVAIYLVPLVLLPMVMLGGALKPAPEMPQLARVVAHGVPSHWAFEGVLGAEAEARPPLPPPRAPSPRYDAAEGHFPEAGRSSPALVLWVLAGNVLLVTVAIGALLVLRDVRP
ncbi:MAG: ATP-binding cassette domain-containing protein [Acidobacteriota bacterium]|jgi:ABC-type multidrug transport system ATPase subunit